MGHRVADGGHGPVAVALTEVDRGGHPQHVGVVGVLGQGQGLADHAGGIHRPRREGAQVGPGEHEPGLLAVDRPVDGQVDGGLQLADGPLQVVRRHHRPGQGDPARDVLGVGGAEGGQIADAGGRSGWGRSISVVPRT